ncbi:hypothetical protein TNCV_4231601 [Trichonephila clavipes]|nr:hypothetical protein TNCV_4231601 [Trichonephila clavipes]
MFACPYRVEFSIQIFMKEQTLPINARFVYAMRSIEKVQKQGECFGGVMNLLQPPTRFSPYVILWISYSEKSQQCSEYAQAIWAIFCISYQLMNILNMVFVPSGKIHGVDLKGL